MPDYIGTPNADVLVGNQGAGLMQGLGGDDVLIADSTGRFTLEGGPGSDRLFGASDRDTLNGGEGADTLEGGAAPDIYSGGSGADVFNWSPASSSVDPNFADTILDWAAEDRLSFANGGVGGGAYQEFTRTDYFSAKAIADSTIMSGAANFVAVQVGGDVAVYADSLNNNGFADDLVILRGRTLADIDAVNFIAAAAPPPPPPPAPVASGVEGAILGNMDTARISSFFKARSLRRAPRPSPSTARRPPCS